MPFVVLNSQASDVDTNCVKNVIRVEKSLKYVESDIEQLGDMSKVILNIKALQSNYKLDENILKTVNLIPTSNRLRDIAKDHGRAAIEDLAQIYEYYSDEIGNFPGTPKSSREILTFSLQATQAAEKELNLLINSIPQDILKPAEEEVSQEFNS
jgi:hypothetical protein